MKQQALASSGNGEDTRRLREDVGVLRGRLDAVGRVRGCDA